MENSKYLAELIELATKLQIDFHEKAGSSDHSWMSSARFFADECLVENKLTDYLKELIPLIEREEFVKHLMKVKSASGSFSLSDKSSISNALASIVDTLKRKMMAIEKSNSLPSPMPGIANDQTDKGTSTASATLQDVDSESDPESGFGRNFFNTNFFGGAGVTSVSGVDASGGVGQLTASDSSNESAFSILSSTRTEIEAESDLLDREKLTIALHRLLTERDDDHAFTIGLFGHWGAGKSSQIKFIEEALNKTKSPQILVARFNAWENENASNRAAMLAQAVVDRLLKDKGVLEKIKLAIQLTTLRQSKTWEAVKGGWRYLHVVFSWLGILLPQIGLILAFVLLVWWIQSSDLFKAVQVWITNLVTAVVAVTATTITFASVYHFIRSHLTDWFKHIDLKKTVSIFSLPDYSSHRGVVLDIHKTLLNLCSKCLKGSTPKEGSYLLLVVDDLDRCKVDTVKDVLDAVRLVANIKRMVTLVAIDERMAFASVEKHYDQFGHAGRQPELVARDYLAKVLQVSLSLPEITGDDIADYIDQKLFGDIVTTEKVYSALSTVREETPVSSNPMLEKDRANFDNSPSQSPLSFEKNLFKDLAQAYNFSNPRLLGRHYMAWKLMKSICLGKTYVEEDVKIPMQLIFWKEWLNQQTGKNRKLYSEWMSGPTDVGPPDMPSGIYNAVTRHLRPYWQREEVQRRLGAVNAVVLPASPREDIDDKEKVSKG